MAGPLQPSNLHCCHFHRACSPACTLSLLAAVLLLVIAPSARRATASETRERDRRPNILLIMADDVGTEVLGCYGGRSFQTPHLDALAESGMRFRHCYSMPVCHPTRICLLTGRYPFRLGHPRWGSFPAAAEQQTIAQTLKRAGYTTAIAGKWQLTLLRHDPQQPHRLGFDQYSLFGWHEGPRYFDPLIYQNGTVRSDTKGRYGPDLYVEFLVDFMKKNRDRPFFAFYSMALCHDVTDDLDEPVPFGPNGRYQTYAEMVESMDAHVGRIVEAVDRLGLRQKTLILFTGDNGTPKSYIHTAEKGRLMRRPVFVQLGDETVRGGKGELTDLGTNVPLIASWKGTIQPAQVVDDLVDFSDFFATFADLAKAPLPEDVAIDGKSFAQRLVTNRAAQRQWAFSERGNNRFFVRTAKWKLYNDGRLFNMAADRREQKPISKSAQSPEAARARAALQKAIAGLGLHD